MWEPASYHSHHVSTEVSWPLVTCIIVHSSLALSGSFPLAPQHECLLAWLERVKPNCALSGNIGRDYGGKETSNRSGPPYTILSFLSVHNLLSLA